MFINIIEILEILFFKIIKCIKYILSCIFFGVDFLIFEMIIDVLVLKVGSVG